MRKLLPLLLLFGLSQAQAKIDITPQADQLAKETVKGGEEEAVRERVNTMVGKNLIAPPKKGTPLNPQVRIIPDYGAIYEEYLSLSSMSQPETARALAVERPAEKEAKEPEAKKEESRKKNSSAVYHLEGVCSFDSGIEMRSLSLPVEVSCLLKDDSGRVVSGVLHGFLTPEGKTYSLILVPKELVVGGKRLKVVEGYALTSDRSSMNLADEVDRELVKKLVLASAQSGITEGFKAYKEYAENRNKEVYTANDNTVAEKNEYPSNYPLVSAVFGALKGAVDTVVGALKEKKGQVPVIFRIFPGKTFWVSLKVAEEK